MKLKSKNLGVIVALVLMLGTAVWVARKNYSTSPNSGTTAPLKVAVSILPQQQIVERIGGDQVEVQALIPPGFSPATYDPNVEDVKFVSQANVYFRIGYIGFEKTNLTTIQELNPRLKIVDTSVNNQLRMLEEHDHEGVEETEPHNGAEIDPHVWLAPQMVKQQAQIIAQTLSELEPDHQEYFAQNLAALDQELDALDQELKVAFAPIQGQTMLVYHPAFGYLADAYGFHQEHIEIEGQDPSLAELQKIITLAKSENIKVIFVQQQFSQDSAQAIAQNIGGAVVQIDPLAPDYLSNISQMAHTISQKLL